MRQIIIENLKKPTIEKATVLIAERKGFGHPDTIMDAICDSASTELSKYYLKHFGTVLHHNVDKGLLVAGSSKAKFGGGKVTSKIKIYIAGRATAQVGKKKVPVKRIVEKAADDYLKQIKNLKKEHYTIYTEIKEGASNLKEVFKKSAQEKIPVANDTSFGVAHAPLSSVEKLVLDVGNLLNGKLKKKYPAIGEDIKVMSWKENNKVHLALAIAFVDKYVKSMDYYQEIKENITKDVNNFATQNNSIRVNSIEINTLDNLEGDESSIYLTATGLSAEQGDDGQVGRGNRPSGLITPNRPMSLEACAGKNINHPGKLYQILAQIIADKISKLSSVKEVYVKLMTQIGKPLDSPLASVELISTNFKKNKVEAEKIINNTFNNLKRIQREIAFGKYGRF